MRKIVFELCAESLEACLAARYGGADRIELCSALSEGGLTPSHGLVCAAVDCSGLPIHTLIRPRGGDFLYSVAEVAVMADDILHMKQLGVTGVVFGLLNPDGTVDRERSRALIELARPMQVTFHRAFDATPSLPNALEDVISIGCDRVLTSGGERDVIAGATILASLIQQAAGRIQVAAGGGLRLQNASSLARLTHALHFHGSLRRRVTPAVKTKIANGRRAPKLESITRYVVDADSVRTIISHLQKAHLLRLASP